MFKRFALSAALLLSTPAFAQGTPSVPAPETQEVLIDTELGPITLAIETERAPVTSANFLRYVDAHRFDGTAFYRAMRLDWGDQPNGLVQGGTQNDPDRVLEPIAHEPTSQTGILHKAGTLSMARYAPGTATGDFSIMLSDQPGLDADPDAADEDARAGYAAFGHVVSGMEIIRQIFDAPIDPQKGEGWMKGQLLAEPVRIETVRRVDRGDTSNASPRPDAQ
ncbi:peptidylprolyl isomerase [Altericroceibacterium xinjiangense]|uniref:peptidylprolyl isomerase n=1 Tax=Altericroceibacterium xinjiangense TaxID=762261 RepID=UPI0019D0A845|nr:peptidylprolyl isomerase [Altericroceibacterium xinjiangense]